MSLSAVGCAELRGCEHAYNMRNDAVWPLSCARGAARSSVRGLNAFVAGSMAAAECRVNNGFAGNSRCRCGVVWPRRRAALACGFRKSTARKRCRVMAMASGSGPGNPIVAQLLEKLIVLLIESQTRRAEALSVRVDAASSVEILDGVIRGISVQAARLEFKDIRLSSGCRFQVDKMEWEPPITITKLLRNPLSVFTPGFNLLEKISTPPKLKAPIQIAFEATLSEADINESPPILNAIRDVLRDLLQLGFGNSILGALLPPPASDSSSALVRAGEFVPGYEILLHKVSLVDAGACPERGYPIRKDPTVRFDAELVVSGTDTTKKSYRMDIRTGVGVGRGGRLIGFLRPEVVLSLFGKQFAVPFVLLSAAGIDLGPDLRLERIAVKPGSTVMTAGVLTIRPPPPRLSAGQSSDSPPSRANTSAKQLPGAPRELGPG
ncbi:hypothetical protein FVE85_8618 [Porphyridium purpureum]|uniref:DUF2993 domain-containing protein n=1 Tax=Porphyridium purpureum TaxID=35688 RepID=A0A5J4YQW3_PORPP|nr:hypothetical protein FVE85_8618 [Porphyridium purpureum]|eukprot:POR1195..scf296_7